MGLEPLQENIKNSVPSTFLVDKILKTKINRNLTEGNKNSIQEKEERKAFYEKKTDQNKTLTRNSLHLPHHQLQSLWCQNARQGHTGGLMTVWRGRVTARVTGSFSPGQQSTSWQGYWLSWSPPLYLWIHWGSPLPCWGGEPASLDSLLPVAVSIVRISVLCIESPAPFIGAPPGEPDHCRKKGSTRTLKTKNIPRITENMKYQNLLLFDNYKKCWKPNFDFQKRLQNFQKRLQN